MRALPATAGRGAVACAAAAPVPRRSLLLSTAAAGGQPSNKFHLCSLCRLPDLTWFYTECLGMKLLRKRDIPEEKYSNAFLGYGPEDSHFVVELTYNYGVDKYDIGEGFGHFGIAVDDVAKTVELIRAKGGKVTRESGPVKGGKTVIAFVEDPDGYKFEILERPATPEPLCQYTVAMMGYGPEDKNAVLELTYNYGVTEYAKGNAYGQIAIGTDDVYKTAEIVKLFGGQVVRETGPLPGINTKITSILDPDGWKSVFVDNIDFAKELE
ncbi:hypothetical protein PR202_gb06872 [Eleusine coracana subsp. coracana]|uniref:Glyoxalase I n=1 Tax=Eleusine coracana subsp. coracana TaxID=191504 RepID=A0AAV5EB61_ELECO|nr:hypothetical protein PR202_gb06872 [Eleusine coracana subsp. coracana]